MESLEKFFSCPYCWESISILLDPTGSSEPFVEDCEVCCNPISFEAGFDGEELIHFEVSRAQ